jgi:hypothetical protein
VSYFAEQATTQEASAGPNHPAASKASVEDELPSAAQARISVATALGVAAANAKLLADQEEREIEHLVASIIDNQVGALVLDIVHEAVSRYLLIYPVRMIYHRTSLSAYCDMLHSCSSGDENAHGCNIS